MERKKPHNQKKRGLSRHLYEPVRQRFIYLRDLLFGGDGREMAFALNLDYRELSRVFTGDLRITVRLLVHVVDRLDVRSEWLLCGVGSIYGTDHETDSLRLPAVLQSSFPTFDTVGSGVSAAAALPTKETELTQSSNIQPYLHAGRAVYHARVNNKLIGFFLGGTTFDAVTPADVLPFYTASFANFLCTTLTAASSDLQAVCSLTQFDINSLAKFAANRGIGYGEAIGVAAFDASADRSKSILASVHDTGLPVVVSVELGEIVAHTAPALHGAETGAAVGAAAYVDLLVLTEHLKSFFGSPGGVFVLVGEHVRGVRLILQRMESLRASVSEPAGFTFIVFAPRDLELETTIHHHGGHVIFLDHPTTAVFSQLFQTCHDVYAGKISHEYK